ncbi:hypothetical protein NKH18_35805 [Streptomyces sp. M10(2022)]
MHRRLRYDKNKTSTGWRTVRLQP